MKIKFLPFIILLICSPIFSANSPTNWYDNLLFKDKSFTYEFIRTLGYTYSGGADIGECISTARQIPDGNTLQWYQQWHNLGNRMFRLGELTANEKNLTSSQELYFRASNYFRTASFYMNSPAQRNSAVSTWEESRLSFLKAITHIPYIRTVQIPYEKIKLPGYFIQTKVKNAPLLIVNTGFDGTAEELYFAVGLAAHRRGYNVLLVEGPGQGEVIKRFNVPFRYDWEHVITPIINFTDHLPDINHQKIALMGISMGGYLVARAAAFEPRINALVLNGGVLDMSQSLFSSLPNSVINLFKTNPKAFNEALISGMHQETNVNWFFNNAMWVFKVTTPLDVVQTLKLYTIKEVADKIKCPTLVIDSTADIFFKNQPQEVYKLLKAPKTLLIFTPEEAAQAHCQVSATSISNEKIFNWLDQTLNWHPVIIN